MNTVSAPLKDFVNEGNRLTEWLGLFWTRIYENEHLVGNIQQGQGLMAAQLYLDYLEVLGVIDRRDVPVFHRERWKPVILKRSDRGKGAANTLRIGMTPTPVIGPQPGGGAYTEGKVHQIGGYAEYTDATSYPLPDDVVDVMTCICDNIAVPGTVLIRGSEFIIRDRTLFFLRSNDPFDNPEFPRRKTMLEGLDDEELILWTVDAMVDKDYVYRHLGYVMGIESISDEFYQRMLNGLWDMHNSGTYMTMFKSGLGAILGEPTVIHPEETVEVILQKSDCTQIVTDREVYEVALGSTLRAQVVPGAKLRAGEFLTETLRIYDTLNPRKLAAANEYGERLRQDMHSMFFPANILRSRLQFGIGASWDYQDIVNTGLDANGNPKLKFEVYGTESDKAIFWHDFWDHLERKNISSETCFQGYIDAIVFPVVGAIYGRVSPLEYFMRYFLQANTVVVVVDRSKLSAPPPDRDPLELLTYMRGVLPAHIRVIVVEQRHPVPEEYDLSAVRTEADKMYATTISSAAYAGTRSTRHMSYLDRPPLMKWIPQCA